MTSMSGTALRGADVLAGRPSSFGAWRRNALQWLTVLGLAAGEMPFLAHLDELRRRLIWSIVSVAIAFVACWMFAEDLLRIARAPIASYPAVQLSIFRPQDIFSLYFKVTLVAALFVAAPMVAVQAWLFIAPGLYRHERRWAIPFVLSASALFVAGGSFGYFIAFPSAVGFLIDWILKSQLVPLIDASEYFNLFFTIIVTLGFVFQIPAVVFVLSRMGLVTAGFLARNFKYAVFGSVVIAAVITPTQDWPNLVIIAGPMIVLYGVGIVVAWLCGRQRRHEPVS